MLDNEAAPYGLKVLEKSVRQRKDESPRELGCISITLVAIHAL